MDLLGQECEVSLTNVEELKKKKSLAGALPLLVTVGQDGGNPGVQGCLAG